jgi:(S)-2-hydroxy-acid oxidase
MVSLADAEQQFAHYRLKTKAEVDCDLFEGLHRETMGVKIPSPICIAATAFQKMAHVVGEVAMAKAAAKTLTPMMLSNWSSTALEEVAGANPHGLKSF